MALTVLNNIASLAAQNQLDITNSNLQKALFQLSSGSRINTGADDAAGLAIANGLEANITALTQSARNANDGVGELQVADGSLAQVTTLLNRAITLSTEAATGTVSDPQRIALDDEYQSIKAEIDRIGAKTNYNGGTVFTTNALNIFLSDGSPTSNSTIGVATGLLSSHGLALGGATPATATLTQAGAAGTAAVATLTGGIFTGATDANDALTTSGLIANNDTVTVAGTVYTFVTALSGLTGQVLIGGGANTTALANLQAAINLAAGAGTTYVGTVANASVTASGSSATNLTLTAKIAGTAGNAIAVSSSNGANTFATPTLATGSDGSTVTIGSTTYQFVNALSGAANEVVVGTEAVSLANLAAAVNGNPAAGTTYGLGTVANGQATAVAGATTDVFTARSPGLPGNSLTSTLTGGIGSFTGATFAGATAPGPGSGVAAAGNTITVGATTYTLVTALSVTPTANEVVVGASDAVSLQNLAAAVNGTTGGGITYGAPTVANAAATAVASPTSVLFTATAGGTGGNTLAATVTGTGNTFGAATFTGGTTGVVNDLLSISDATATLATINTAIQTVAGLRGTIGATVNRLQSAANVINNQVQNLTGAEDGVTAADIPSTVAALAKYSILEQTGISAVAQANQIQNLVLKLLQ